MPSRCTVASLAIALAGCATTSGSAWVREPEAGAFTSQDSSLAVTEGVGGPGSDPWRAPLASEERARARPRLSRTITLGEVTTAPSERPETPSAAAAPVTVTINNTVGGSGAHREVFVPYAAGSVGAEAPAAPRSRPLTPGQDWPAPRSYGPAFPFKTAPAPAWPASR